MLALVETSIFVLALYTSPESRKHRDEPNSIIARVAIASSVALGLTVFERVLGHEWPLLDLSIRPLLLTLILFLGPLYTQPELMQLPDFDLQSLRSLVVAPIVEELVFRYCISHHTHYSPVYFSLAHLHHGLIRWFSEPSSDRPRIIAATCLQLSYTLLFGAYTSFLYSRTGRIMDCILVHALCNHFGFPGDFDWWETHRVQGSIAYLLGLFLFIALLYPLSS
ncbi:MAG: hypothetical protein SGCHY_002077 [Lobulomycetales sp.]